MEQHTASGRYVVASHGKEKKKNKNPNNISITPVCMYSLEIIK